MKTKTRTSWWGGFRTYPKSVAYHILQGVAAGVLVGIGDAPLIITGVLWTLLFVGYQVGSGWRKQSTEGHTDTVGLDIQDFAVGFIPAAIITHALALATLP